MARILIVDDEEMDRLFQSSILREAGHELIFAADGQIALTMWKKRDVDLVITDLVMPEMNGLRLIRAIREEDPMARIIAVSGLAPDQLDLAENYGALKTLFKPIAAEQLLSAVEEVLGEFSPEDDDPWRRAR
jgi:CheY-like chemotaxis protein